MTSCLWNSSPNWPQAGQIFGNDLAQILGINIGWEFHNSNQGLRSAVLMDEMSRQIQRPLTVTAFVDWNSQIHNANADRQEPKNRAKQTLEMTTKSITKVLLSEDSNKRYDVSLRLYHGWHKGWEKTENLRAIMNILGEPDFPSVFSGTNVVFRQAVQFGHTLLAAIPKRLHISQQIHLANTLRQRNGKSDLEEKMTDSALAADLLHWARETPSQWALILAEDDDIVPPIFTAEAWIQSYGGRVYIVRKRSGTQYAITDGILRRWNS